ncbi:MAG TPA: endonuclease/exonuclease/phosphatase family protein [Pyrinomonadaceae bacterium]|nr:endonuclease/exonuclease/phosphatase family protein [Pyrinomonadaceae bacterium]
MTRRPFSPTHLLAAALACLLIASAVGAQTQAPELLTYDELVQLYEQPTPPAVLQEKLSRLLRTPFVSNAASARGVKPLLPSAAGLGRFLRVVEWNIERGLEFDAIRAAFTDPDGFARLMDTAAYPRGSEKRRLVLQQVALMQQADVVVLNEVDFGMKRTGYRDVAAELAEALRMNYAFGVEFVEVDPIALGLEKFEELPAEERAKLVSEIKVDRARYRGLHGTAILSRFPLENVRLEPFDVQPHDWYKDELAGVKAIEEGKRKAGELVFQEKILREVRRGGRMMLTAEVADARLPGGRLTVVATHLEDKTKPEGRRKQLEELLARIKDVDAPVVVAGDMNTSTQDGTPLSVERLLKNRLGSRSFWLKQGLGILTGVRLPTMLLGGVNAYRKQADPTVRSIALVASNPEAEFFDRLKEFRFADGGAFDFRGDSPRSVGGKDDTLANSNQRGDKGFITTYEVERTIAFVGKFKLDWIFVKPPGLTDPHAKAGPYLFAPHFGRTLKSLNDSLRNRISDHAPLTADLPLAEPRLVETKEGRGN